MQADPDAVCDECQRQGAFAFDGRTLCESCYATIAATCCSGETDEE